MSMKRFCISSDSNQNIYDTEEKYYYSSIDAMKLCALLNELYEENQNLHGKASTWKITASEEIVEKEALMKQIVELKQKNRQLNSENKMLKNTIARNESYIEKLTHKGEWSN